MKEHQQLLCRYQIFLIITIASIFLIFPIGGQYYSQAPFFCRYLDTAKMSNGIVTNVTQYHFSLLINAILRMIAFKITSIKMMLPLVETAFSLRNTI